MTGATPADAISHAIRSNVYLYPAAEVVHLWGILLVAGAAVLFDLRVLGLIRAAPVAVLARQLLPWSLIGLLLVVPAGLVLFAADPFTLLGNTAFRIKFLLLATLAFNAVAFHLGPARAAIVPTSSGVPGIAQAQALLSLCLWLAVVACGRFIAYV
jgi:hypothetical protein